MIKDTLSDLLTNIVSASESLKLQLAKDEDLRIEHLDELYFALGQWASMVDQILPHFE